MVLMDNTAQYTRLKHNGLPPNSGIIYFTFFCQKRAVAFGSVPHTKLTGVRN